MKRFILILGCILLCACSASDGTPAATDSTEMPVKLTYDRLWEYSAQGETEDPELIKAVLDAVSELKTGKETTMAVDDYTDIIVFTYADGGMIRYEFEDNILVDKDGKRYLVEGDLNRIRDMLEEVLDDHS